MLRSPPTDLKEPSLEHRVVDTFDSGYGEEAAEWYPPQEIKHTKEDEDDSVEAVMTIRNALSRLQKMGGKGTMSQYAEALLTVDMNPFSLRLRNYLKCVYNIDKDISAQGSRNIILIAGRQVEKSTTLAGKAIILGATNPAWKTLTIQPRLDQVRVFSQQRFAPMCEDSPPIKQLWMGNKCLWQVTSRAFRNRAFYNFRSCYYSADAVRGITANFLQIDELQDIISDNIPVLEECQAHFQKEPEKLFNLYAGTPKTTSNTLNRWWKESCQFEWFVKCEHCKNENFLNEKIIGLKSYICTRCGKPIYMHNGIWRPMRPSKIGECWGFRISQLMVPFMSHTKIFKKLNDPNLPRRMFFNEVLGLPYDEGELVLTEADIRMACEETRPVATPKEMWKFQVPLCVGIDHGTGAYTAVDPYSGVTKQSQRTSRSQASFTVMAFGGFTGDGKFRIFKIIKFLGEDANLARQPAIIDKYTREWGGQWAMSDWGFGAQTNQSLITRHNWGRTEDGVNPLLLECQYVRSTKLATFNPQAYRYMVDRNFAIEQTVDAIKSGKLLFFRWEEMQHYVDDFTSIYVEYDQNYNRIKYDHILPDDCFHAVAYCYMAARQRTNQLVPTGVPNI